MGRCPNHLLQTREVAKSLASPTAITIEHKLIAVVHTVLLDHFLISVSNFFVIFHNFCRCCRSGQGSGRQRWGPPGRSDGACKDCVKNGLQKKIVINIILTTWKTMFSKTFLHPHNMITLQLFSGHFGLRNGRFVLFDSCK